MTFKVDCGSTLFAWTLTRSSHPPQCDCHHDDWFERCRSDGIDTRRESMSQHVAFSFDDGAGSEASEPSGDIDDRAHHARFWAMCRSCDFGTTPCEDCARTVRALS